MSVTNKYVATISLKSFLQETDVIRTTVAFEYLISIQAIVHSNQLWINFIELYLISYKLDVNFKHHHDSIQLNAKFYLKLKK